MGTLLMLLALTRLGGEQHIDLGGGVSPDLVVVEAGRLLQGSRTDASGRNDDEVQRRVTITRDSYLGKYPVTRAQLAAFVKASGHRTEAENGTSGGFALQGKELVQQAGFTQRNAGFAQGDDHAVSGHLRRRNGVLPMGIDAALVIGTPVRLHPDKRLDLWLEALRIAAPDLPPHVLRIAGDPDQGCEADAAHLRQAAAPLQVPWLPSVSEHRGLGVGGRGEPSWLLQSFDLFAMIAEPAACPNASLEAMAAGLPVLITDWGGVREQAEDGWNGRVVARDDVVGLARALVELARDRNLLRATGRNSHARAGHEFSLARMAAQYRSVCLNQEPLPIATTLPGGIVAATT